MKPRFKLHCDGRITVLTARRSSRARRKLAPVPVLDQARLRHAIYAVDCLVRLTSRAPTVEERAQMVADLYPTLGNNELSNAAFGRCLDMVELMPREAQS